MNAQGVGNQGGALARWLFPVLAAAAPAFAIVTVGVILVGALPRDAAAVPVLVALLGLVGVHVALAYWAVGAVRDSLVLLALGVWIFVGVAGGGLLAAASIATGDAPAAVDQLDLRMILTGAVVALYAVLVLLVRRWWIVEPIGRMFVGLEPLYDPARVPARVTVGASGYFTDELERARLLRLGAIGAGKERQGLSFEATLAYVEAFQDKDLVASRDALAGQLTGAAQWNDELVRHHARVIVLNGPGEQSFLYLAKVQNQLLVFTFLLLAAVAAFSALGWAAPMAVAATAAIVFRIRNLLPLGNPLDFDGGSRWMALFLTPLTGAVSAVLGLNVLSALAEADMLSAALATDLHVAGFGLTAEPPHFDGLQLGIAIAFGWSAKLLDTMLGKLTDIVEKQKDAPAAAEAAAAPDKTTGETPDAETPDAAISAAERAGVEAALLEQLGTVKVAEVRKKKHGSFEAEVVRQGVTSTITVSADLTKLCLQLPEPGEAKSPEAEPVAASAAERAGVEAALVEGLGAVTVKEVRKKSDGSFEADIRCKGASRTIAVSADLTRLSLVVPLPGVPAVVPEEAETGEVPVPGRPREWAGPAGRLGELVIAFLQRRADEAPRLAGTGGGGGVGRGRRRMVWRNVYPSRCGRAPR